MPPPSLPDAKNGNPVHHRQCASETSSHALKDELPCKKHVSGEEHIYKGCTCQGKMVPTYGFTKLPLKHWWEVPPGLGSRGRDVQSMLSLQTGSKSSVQSDLTFDGGAICSVHRDDVCSESAPADVLSPCNASIHSRERVRDHANKRSPNRAVPSKLESPTSAKGSLAEAEGLILCEAHQQISRWSEEEGKMIIQRDVFNAVLPSTDEVGLQWRISELRVALRASESARKESEQETESLRTYLAEVEAAAAGLQSRVQELEHILSFSSKGETSELDELRAKMVLEISKEVRSQTARSAKAVAAAREATMELDKVKRHAASLIKAQEEEAERLRLEAAECRTLYHARAGQLHSMKEQIEKLEKDKSFPLSGTKEALKASQEKLSELQKCLDVAKLEAQEKSGQFVDLLEAFETQGRAVQAIEDQLKELEQQKAKLANHNDWLTEESQQEAGGTEEHYSHELCKARAVLGAEKQHLLNELASLRSGNRNLQIELAEWQERYHVLSKHVSGGTETINRPKSNAKGGEAKQPWCDDASEIGSCELHMKGLEKCNACMSDAALAEACSYDGGYGQHVEEKESEVQECPTPTTTLGSCNSNCFKNGNGLTNYRPREYRVLAKEGKHSKFSGKEHKLSGPRNYSQRRTNCNFVKDDLLAAAHREIVRLKEVNHCLLTACEKRVQLDSKAQDQSHC